jgi:hypothetical protein
MTPTDKHQRYEYADGNIERELMSFRTIYFVCTILTLGSAVLAQQTSQPSRSNERIAKGIQSQHVGMPCRTPAVTRYADCGF